jgi:hypothetical protein
MSKPKKTNKMGRTIDKNYKLILRNRRFLIMTALLAWANFILIMYVLKPSVTKITRTTNKLSSQQQELSKLEQKLSELNQIHLSDEFRKKDKVDEVLPSHKPLLELLANLNQAAKKTKILFTNFEISPGKVASPGAEVELNQGGQGYNSLELELSIKGLNADVEEFISLVEKIAPLTTITQLEISRQETQPEQAQHQLEQAVQRQNANGTATASGQNQDLTDDQTQTEFNSDQAHIVTTANMIMLTYYYTKDVESTLSSSLPSVGEEEVKVFDTIQKFRPSNFEPQTELKHSDLEDIFGVEGIFN